MGLKQKPSEPPPLKEGTERPTATDQKVGWFVFSCSAFRFQTVPKF
jgi:hypothetical protein